MTTRDDIEQIPGVGTSIARDLRHIGITTLDQLKGRDPEELYQQLCDFKAQPVDRCMLYVLRCAVYYASTGDPRPELLKWWNWKDAEEEGQAVILDVFEFPPQRISPE